MSEVKQLSTSYIHEISSLGNKMGHHSVFSFHLQVDQYVSLIIPYHESCPTDPGHILHAQRLSTAFLFL